MSRNLSDSKQERDLLNRIARLEQQMRERGTTQFQGEDTINMKSTGPFTLTSSAPIPSLGNAIVRFALSNTEAKMVFAHFRFTIYAADFADPDWRIPDNSLANYWLPFTHWTDWHQTEESTSGINQVEYILIHNESEFDLDLTVVGEWKYIVNGGEVVVG